MIIKHLHSSYDMAVCDVSLLVSNTLLDGGTLDDGEGNDKAPNQAFLLKILFSCQKYRFECTEIDIGATEACQNVELCSAWRQGLKGFFYISTQIRLPQKYAWHSNQIWCEAWGQWGFISLCSPSGSASSKGARGKLTWKFGIFFKYLVIYYQAQWALIMR